ncbi:MAG: TatD family deoxyribonuclease [Deltaproteobacteria bacterium]|nr:MAG: TatD family deoxyribonuclease [Deltaproteobacteria bacterium]TDJ21525.1 MAG: TatD family deoxyribonuclease [Deltaproteobacteria bacterium]
MWIDSHCHVTADEFAQDRREVLDRAEADGVSTFIGIGSGYGVSRNRLAVELAEVDSRVFATVGVHPHEAKELDDAGRSDIETLLSHPRVVGVGECGLDYHYMNSERDVQRKVFAWQVALAREKNLPVSLHVRGDEPNAFAETLDIWRQEGGGEVDGVLHCYTGNLEFARRALDERLEISFSGILTFKRDRGLRDVARGLPLDRLMVETDAPLLSPEGHRGQRNEPARVVVVGTVLAKVHGVAVEEVAATTSRNARRLFRMPEDAA